MSSIWKNKYRKLTQTWNEKTSKFIAEPAGVVEINPYKCDIDPDPSATSAYGKLFVSPHTDYPDLTNLYNKGTIQATTEVRRVLMKVKGMTII